jgi:hypothetical protein
MGGASHAVQPATGSELASGLGKIGVFHGFPQVTRGSEHRRIPQGKAKEARHARTKY